MISNSQQTRNVCELEQWFEDADLTGALDALGEEPVGEIGRNLESVTVG